MKLFKDIFCNNIPLLDVRAPIEFAQGAFPYAYNLPLLNNDERHQIGLAYKQQGRDAAIKLGHQTIKGDIKSQRIKLWQDFCIKNPNAYLYCFRGGMRSQLVQQWLGEHGVQIPLVKGGYKALRNYLLKVIEKPVKMIRISGQTGVGKTDLLVKLQHKIDLEALANHRGSAFGKQLTNQPTQINFENNLAIEMIKVLDKTNKAIIVEDESRYIGSINLPHTFVENMKNSPVIILKSSKEQRVNRIFQDYIVSQRQCYLEKHSDIGAEYFADSLQLSLDNIHKRLGGVRYKHLKEIMGKALTQQSEELHKKWIADLLEFYYDPMYNYQLEKKSKRVIFSGNQSELYEYIANI